LFVLVAVCAALSATSPAQAHVHTGVVAVDYRASVLPLHSLQKALALRIYTTDRALALTVRPGHSVTVIGYLHEPFIRVGAGGVLVNEASPTAAAAGLLRHPQRPGETKPRWVTQSHGETVVWHAPGLRGLPPGIKRARWQVPVLVDGQHATLAGEIWRVPPPSLWRWLSLGAPFAASVALILIARRRAWLRLGAAVFGALAAVAAIGTAAAFALAASASGGRWVEGANEFVFALVGLAFLLRSSPNGRGVAGGALGVLALSVGLSRIPVLLHGVVLSAFPATPTRLAVVLAIWAGAAATALGLVVFFEMLDEPQSLPPAVRRRSWE
jgi:hypothetical protein